jgi:hypothetical protein
MQCEMQFNGAGGEHTPMTVSTLPMPRSTSDAQVTFRTDTQQKTQLDVIAAALDEKVSDLVREAVADALPRLRRRADEEISKREKLPVGITAEALDRSLAALVRRLSLREPIQLDTQDLLAPDSKALWVLLSYLWGEHPTADEHRAAAEALAAVVGQKLPTKKK